MTYDEFVNKWKGKGIDFDGAYGDQCMDLMHQYVVEVCGLTDGRILAAPAAKDVYLGYPNTFGSDHFDKFDNTPTGFPQRGDIMFWGTGIGPYGHVAIIQSATVDSFTSFDQNWNAHQYCELVQHNYTGVLGWLRPKTSTAQTGDSVTLSATKFAELVNKSTKYDLFVSAGYDSVDKVKDEMKKRDDTIGNLNTQVTKLTSEHSAQATQVSSLSSQVTTLNGELESLREQAKQWVEKQKLYDQMEKDYNADKIRWAAYQETTNRQIAQLKNTSMKTLPTQSLISEVLRRAFHINS